MRERLSAFRWITPRGILSVREHALIDKGFGLGEGRKTRGVVRSGVRYVATESYSPLSHTIETNIMHNIYMQSNVRWYIDSCDIIMCHRFMFDHIFDVTLARQFYKLNFILRRRRRRRKGEKGKCTKSQLIEYE